MQIFLEEKKRNGLAMILRVRCSSCQSMSPFALVKRIDRIIELNCRSLLATNALKRGRQAVAKFCGIINLPIQDSFKSFNETLQKCQQQLSMWKKMLCLQHEKGQEKRPC